jgi:hypothetical protein
VGQVGILADCFAVAYTHESAVHADNPHSIPAAAVVNVSRR